MTNQQKITKVNLQQEFAKIHEHWQPKIAGELNGQLVKLAKLQGEFVAHTHDEEDELFLVVSGTLLIELHDHTLEIQPGEFVIIPKGVEHKPIAKEEVELLLFEPASTLNTGDKVNDMTLSELDRI